MLEVSYATVYVTDQDRALDFYTRVLGLEKLRDLPLGPGSRWIEVGTPGAATTILLYRPTEASPGGRDVSERRSRIGHETGIGLRTDDIKAVFERLRVANARIDEEPRAESWGTQGIFADPDGNRFVVVQPPG